MTIRNVIVACDYAYIEGGAARVAVQTAVELSKREVYTGSHHAIRFGMDLAGE